MSIFIGDLALEATHPKGVVEGRTLQTGNEDLTQEIPLGPHLERERGLAPL